jgi:hypothetical protein
MLHLCKQTFSAMYNSFRKEKLRLSIKRHNTMINLIRRFIQGFDMSSNDGFEALTDNVIEIAQAERCTLFFIDDMVHELYKVGGNVSQADKFFSSYSFMMT